MYSIIIITTTAHHIAIIVHHCYRKRKRRSCRLCPGSTRHHRKIIRQPCIHIYIWRSITICTIHRWRYRYSCLRINQHHPAHRRYPRVECLITISRYHRRRGIRRIHCRVQPRHIVQPCEICLHIVICIIRRDNYTERYPCLRIASQICRRYYVTYSSWPYRYQPRSIIRRSCQPRIIRRHRSAAHIVRLKCHTRPTHPTQIIRRRPKCTCHIPCCSSRRITYIIPMCVILRRVHS